MNSRKVTFLGLHGFTWVLLFVGVIGVALLQGNHARMGGADGSSGAYHRTSYHGWPTQIVTRHESGWDGWTPSPPPEVSYEWRLTGILVNVLVGVVIVFSMAYTAESWLRSQFKFQFALSSLCVLLFALAATLAIIKFRGPFFGVSLNSILGLQASSHWVALGVELPWYFQFAVAGGLLCTSYTAVSLFVLLIRSMPRSAPLTKHVGKDAPHSPH